MESNMRSDFNLPVNIQKQNQAERIAAVNAREHARAAYLAENIALAAARQEVRTLGETAEDYLVRINIDMSKI
jgi:hypothetical protein